MFIHDNNNNIYLYIYIYIYIDFFFFFFVRGLEERAVCKCEGEDAGERS